MEFVNLHFILCVILLNFSNGLEINSKVNFENEESREELNAGSESTEQEASESRDVESTTPPESHRIKKPKKTDRLRDDGFEAKIPLLVGKVDQKYEIKIPVKLQPKKDKPKNNVKFYKGTNVGTSTSTTTEKSIETSTTDKIVPVVVKGSFSNVKPDFLVPIPKDLPPLVDNEDYRNRLWNRLKAEHIEGLYPPPIPLDGNRPPWGRLNCSESYSGSCFPNGNGGNYPNVGPIPTSPTPTYGPPNTPTNPGNWNQGNNWMNSNPNYWNRPNSNDNWLSQNWPQGGQDMYWNYQQRPPYDDNTNPNNRPRPVYGPPGNNPDNPNVRPRPIYGPPTNNNNPNIQYWNSQNSPNPQYPQYPQNPQNPQYPRNPQNLQYPQNPQNPQYPQSQSGYPYYRPSDGRPFQQVVRNGRWYPCKPFELPTSREIDHVGCPQDINNRPLHIAKFDLPPATPASKIDDKTLFQEVEKPPEIDETKARIIQTGFKWKTLD